MFYQFFKQLVGFSLSIYFKKIQFIDKHNLPKKGPVIIVANHPSAVLDPIVIATKVNGKLSYIAAAEWFGKGIKNWIFKSQFNMIPVYRPWIEKSKNKSNQRMFEDCTNSLNKDSRIIIFPEGTSVTSHYIRELKTGTARMKLDYESHPESTKPLLIIPIGLNYSNPHQFNSTVVVKVGKPIEFEKIATENSTPDELQVISKALTDQIQKGMDQTMVNIKPGKNAELITQSIEILDSDDFKINQNLALHIASKKDDERFLTFKKGLSSFYGELKKADLPSSFSESINLGTHFLMLLLLSPLYLLFAVTYGLPLLFARFVFNQFLDDKIDSDYESDKLNPSFKGTLIFLAGMAVLLSWMVASYLLIGLFLKQWLLGLLIFVLAYPIIKIGLFIHHKILEYKIQIKVNRFKKNNLAFFKKLSASKSELVNYIKGELLRFETN